MSARADPSNIIVYGFIRDDMGAHYSNDDFGQYNKYIEGKLGITIQRVGLSENIYNNFEDFVGKIAGEAASGKNIFFIFIADVFFAPCEKIEDYSYFVDLTDDEMRLVERWNDQGKYKQKKIIVYKRDSKHSPDEIKRKLEELQRYGTIIPEIDFMYSTGSKYYVVDPDLNKLMLQPTLTFPIDNNKIDVLPDGEYILKKGFASSNFGNTYYEGSGDKLVQAINIVNNKGMRAVKPSYLKLEKEKQEFQLWRATYHEYIVCDDYTIVQPKSDLYANCHEFKFGVLDDKIICVTSDKHFETINYENEINPHILQFVRNIIDIVKRKWPKYFYVRIDIMVECNPADKDAILHDTGTGPAPAIYLNEIEPLGSGLKRLCNNIDDNKIKKPTGIFDKPPWQHMYEGERVEQLIADELVKLIERNLVGGIKRKKYRLVRI